MWGRASDAMNPVPKQAMQRGVYNPGGFSETMQHEYQYPGHQQAHARTDPYARDSRGAGAHAPSGADAVVRGRSGADSQNSAGSANSQQSQHAHSQESGVSSQERGTTSGGDSAPQIQELAEAFRSGGVITEREAEYLAAQEAALLQFKKQKEIEAAQKANLERSSAPGTARDVDLLGSGDDGGHPGGVQQPGRGASGAAPQIQRVVFV